MKERIVKVNFIKIKDFCSVKGTMKSMKRQATDWEKIFEKAHLIKDCYPKYAKNSSNSK